MQISAFLLCLMVGGFFAVQGQRCDYSKCKVSNLFGQLEAIRFLPNAQQLREYCQQILRFLDCNTEVVESCVGKTINEIAASSDQSAAEDVAILLGVGSLVRDLCNPHSTLHKDYVENVECARGFSVVGPIFCGLEAQETMEHFYEQANIEKGGLDDALNAEIRCLEQGYEVTCLTFRLGESCGESARSALVTIVRRLKGVIQSKCEGGPSDLKNKFYSYMDVDATKKSQFQETFELFRRRR